MKLLDLFNFRGNDLTNVDTLTFRIPESKQPLIKYDNMVTKIDKSGHTYHAIKNFSLRNSKFRSNSFKNFSGSVSKYIRGSNVDPITYNEFFRCLEELSNSLGVNLFEVPVYRIDLAVTFEMKKDVSLLLKNLYSPYRTLKLDERHKTSKYYHFKGYEKYITVSYYDKGKEAKLEGNFLRYEVQFYKNMLNRKLKSTNIITILKNMLYLEKLMTDILLFFEVKSSENLLQLDLTNHDLGLIDEARANGLWNVVKRLSEYRKIDRICYKTEYRHLDILIKHNDLIRSSEFEEIKKETKKSYFRKLECISKDFLYKQIACGCEVKYVPITIGGVKKGRAKEIAEYYLISKLAKTCLSSKVKVD